MDGCKERVKEQYSPASTDVWIRPGRGIGDNNQVCTVEISYLKGACELTRWEGEMWYECLCNLCKLWNG